jgi:hypothetical protein
VSQVFLDFPDVDSFEQHVRGKGMPQAMDRSGLVDSGLTNRVTHDSLRDLIADMMPTNHPASRVDSKIVSGEQVLPAELLWRGGILSV